MRDSRHHVDADDLERYSMGTGAQDELVEEHLLVCEGCQDRLRETEEYVLAMRMAGEQCRRDERVVNEREWHFPTWLPSLAATACLLFVVVALYLFQPSAAVVAVSLNALRGNGIGASAPAGQSLLLQPDLTGLPESSAYKLEIVDQTGKAMRQGTLGRGHEGLRLRGLASGQYFVRVYRPAGDLLREYGLEIR